MSFVNIEMCADCGLSASTSLMWSHEPGRYFHSWWSVAWRGFGSRVSRMLFETVFCLICLAIYGTTYHSRSLNKHIAIEGTCKTCRGIGGMWCFVCGFGLRLADASTSFSSSAGVFSLLSCVFRSCEANDFDFHFAHEQLHFCPLTTTHMKHGWRLRVV